MEPRRSRRTFLKSLGAITTGTTLVTPVTASHTPKDDEINDPVVRPQFITDISSRWSPQTIDLGNHSILESSWDVDTGLITIHRYDALVEAAKVSRPEYVATNLNTSQIEKNWIYESDSALGVPAYHFKAVATVTTPGRTIYVDSKVVPNERSRILAYTGVYFDPLYAIREDWVGAYLDVE